MYFKLSSWIKDIKEGQHKARSWIADDHPRTFYDQRQTCSEHYLQFFRSSVILFLFVGSSHNHDLQHLFCPMFSQYLGGDIASEMTITETICLWYSTACWCMLIVAEIYSQTHFKEILFRWAWNTTRIGRRECAWWFAIVIVFIVIVILIVVHLSLLSSRYNFSLPCPFFPVAIFLLLILLTTLH